MDTIISFFVNEDQMQMVVFPPQIISKTYIGRVLKSFIGMYKPEPIISTINDFILTWKPEEHSNQGRVQNLLEVGA